LVQVETNVLRPVHIRVACGLTLLADVQTTLNTLIRVCPPADTTRFARVTLIHFHNRNSLTLRLVCENLGEAVERPPVHAFTATVATIPGFASLVIFTNTFEVADNNCPDTTFNTLCYA
jgi:hypothetical protein